MDAHAALPGSFFLDIARDGDRLVFSLRRSFDEHLGLRLRRGEACRRVKMDLRSIGPAARSDDGTEFSVDGAFGDYAGIAIVLKQIDRDLEVIAERPLTSRLVQGALGITGRERIRWTKDGRLTASGTYTIQRQQVITLSAYAVDYIRGMVAQPQLIQAWREADDKAAAFDEKERERRPPPPI